MVISKLYKFFNLILNILIIEFCNSRIIDI